MIYCTIEVLYAFDHCYLEQYTDNIIVIVMDALFPFFFFFFFFPFL